MFLLVILVPELFKKLRETPGNKFHQVSSKSDLGCLSKQRFCVFCLVFLVSVVLVVVLVAFRLVVRVVASHYCDYQEERHQNHHQDHHKQKKRCRTQQKR